MRNLNVKKFKCVEKKTKYNPKTQLEIKTSNDLNVHMVILLDTVDGFMSIRLNAEQVDKLKKFLA